jgi:Tfp pilus assembly protein PilF
MIAVAGCATRQPPAATTGLTEVIERRAERALLAGMRAYDDGQYADSEKSLTTALAAGLAGAKDRALAHKLLAFIYCTSERIAECEAAFRAARAADPTFMLSRSEAGHPQWGPVYRSVMR